MPFAPFPGRDSDVEVINSYADGDVNLTARRGTLASGKQRKARYAIDIKSEPLLFDLNEMNLGGRLAEVWAQRIRDNILGIAVRASDATIAMRTKAAAAFGSGQAWATKRYAGGRIGPMAPNQSDKLFNDSGRLAAGVTVRSNLTDASYTVNLPANRFNRETFGVGYDAMVAKFVSLVPMLDPKKALGDPQIEAAIKESVAQMVTKATDASEAAIQRSLAKLRAAKLRVLKQIGGVAARGLGL
jgi:hypothetical protein